MTPDPYTGERKCGVCGNWYYPQDDRDADLRNCGPCNRQIDMQVEEIMLERNRTNHRVNRM